MIKRNISDRAVGDKPAEIAQFINEELRPLARELRARFNALIADAGIMLGGSDEPGVYFGEGEPAIEAAKGSLYLRTDGSSTSTRAYVNTDGGTAWTSLTAAS